MELHNLTKMSSKLKRKRVGRGDTTAGRGQKGYLSRSGSSIRPGFRGGQTPVYQQIHKLRGGKALVFKKSLYQVINLDDLSRLTDEVIDMQALLASRLINKKSQPVKILSMGEYTGKAKEIKVNAMSAVAKEKLEKAGVKVTLLVMEVKENPAKRDTSPSKKK
jgi:large subunit ribosomal protein L15